MIETKQFKFVRNLLWPFPSTIEISENGITNKKKPVRWEDVAEVSYGINVINGAMNYVLIYRDTGGKRFPISFVVPITGSKKKKALFAEIYAALATAFHAKVVVPRAQAELEKIQSGQTVELAKCKVSKSGIEIRKGMVKKTPVFVEWNDVTLAHIEGQGGVQIASLKERKDTMLVKYLNNPESRILEHVMGQLIPVGLRK